MVTLPFPAPEGLDPIVYVPVRQSRLGEVYRVLGSAPEADGPGEPAAELEEPAEELEWTVEELRRLVATVNTSAGVVGKILDVLAVAPGVRVSTTELEDRTEVKRANIKGSLSAFTRHIKKHYPGHGWPMRFDWGPNLARDEPGQVYAAEGYYSVDEHVADLWRQARSS